MLNYMNSPYRTSPPMEHNPKCFDCLKVYDTISARIKDISNALITLMCITCFLLGSFAWGVPRLLTAEAEDYGALSEETEDAPIEESRCQDRILVLGTINTNVSVECAPGSRLERFIENANSVFICRCP